MTIHPRLAALVLIVVGIFWFDRDGLRDHARTAGWCRIGRFPLPANV